MFKCLFVNDKLSGIGFVEIVYVVCVCYFVLDVDGRCVIVFIVKEVCGD